MKRVEDFTDEDWARVDPLLRMIAEMADEAALNRSGRAVRVTRRARPSTAKPLRIQVFDRDGYRCRECGEVATEIDHIRPRWDGGRDELPNLQALCAGCHSDKTRLDVANALSVRGYFVARPFE